MKNTEKQKFEEAWSKAFQQAEQTPTENVWMGVESNLNYSEKALMKRRVIFYQRLAASTILFALVMAGITTFYLSDFSQPKNLSLQSGGKSELKQNINEEPTNTSSQLSFETNDSILTEDKVIKENIRSSNTLVVKDGSKSSSQIITDLSNSLISQEDLPESSDRISRNIQIYPAHLSDLIASPEVIVKSSLRDVTLVRKLPAMPAVFMASRESNRKVNESVWASIGAAAGNYTNSISSFGSATGQSSYLTQNGTTVGLNRASSSTSSSKGSAFSFGMNFGKRISRKWLMQGGVSYLTQSIGYTSNFATISSSNQPYAAVADYTSKNFAQSTIQLSNPYQINSLNEFISVPIQAGYIIVDNKFGLQLNSGLSTDFFIQNTLSDKSGQLSSYSTGSGTDSPFRTVSWAGLMGTELSYKIGSSYRLSLVPGIRYSLNSILKTDAVQANPLVWDVGFRCRYIFK